MTNLTRVTGKIFGETASTSNTPKEIGQFGSAKAGTYNATGDVATIQNLSAWSNGWIDAVTPTQQFPSLPEMTGVHKVLSYQNAYLLQKGVAEWDSGTTYYTGDFCKGVGEGKLYVSKVDSNINHAVTDSDYWEEFSSGASRNIGEIVTSTIPLTDAGLHLLDGALLTYGSYQAFIDYIADLYDSGNYAQLFDTEANWQASDTTYGVCGKFVYDSVNNTVRLPKITGIIEGTTDLTALGDLIEAGLPNITGKFANKDLPDSTNGQYTCFTDVSGAFAIDETGLSSFNGAGSGSNGNSLKMDASYSSSIYGNSNTVQPQAIKVLYYIVVSTTTKTNIEVDIDEIATDLNGKMDTDGTNAVSSVKFADGQWVNNYLALASGVTIPTSTNTEYDISSYLPNDTYDYEVLLTGTITTGAGTGKFLNLLISTDTLTNYIRLCAAQTRTSTSVVGAGSASVPVSTGRKIIVNAYSGYDGTYNLVLVAYRRIGTNQ